MTEVKTAEAPVTQRPWLVLAIMCVGFFMALLDGSIVNIAIPRLIDGLDASYDQVLWIIDGYMLVFSVLLITTGRLGDICGYRRLFLIGITLFTVASALCGLSESPDWLLAARVLQGLGGALLFPQVISSILTIFPPQLRGRAFGLFGAIVGFAPIVGPVIGGFLLAHLSWRWIFFINVPIGIVTALLAVRYVPVMRPGRSNSLDLTGVALATTGLTGIVFGLIEGERYDWGTITGPISIASVIIAGVVLLVLFVLWQHRRKTDSLMPLALFNARNFSVGNGVGFIFQLGMIAIAFVLVLYLQTARGYSALETAAVMLPNAILTAVGSTYAGRLSDKFGGKYVLMAGLAMLTVGLLVLVAATDAHSDAWSLLPGLIIIGVASGATFAPLQQATMDGVNPQLAGAASGVSNTTRQVGGVLGTAVLGALLSARINADLPKEAQEQAAQLPSALRDQFLAAADSAGNFSPPSVPSGLSVSEADLFRRLGDDAFATSFTHAMHVTFLVAAAVLIAATVLCGLFTTPPRAEPAMETAGEEDSRVTPED
ncbi:MFS transporter [Streptomyces chartreusis]|uniref:MFS transporter n=1 Tax=Streptomyces chartreusis TaxID=1969 RepID=UPI002E824B55|nr:MFS transporter [Streptomyces chartreusis]WUB22450.1 MFS transporter [Streptomyces chartreusis]